jgi:hypothetical protein
MISQTSLRRFLKVWQPAIVLVAVALWTVITAGVSAWWSARQYNDQIKLKQQELVAKTAELAASQKQREAELAANDKQREADRAENERQLALSRKLEAQQPFLKKKLDVYFSAIEAARKLTDSHLKPDEEEWKQNATRFWELRWGELEMVGDAGVRQAARRVTYQITELEYNPNRDRRDLRWMVECLADELRLSLEHAWGYEPNALRVTATGEGVSKLPGGCRASAEPPSLLPGMQSFAAPANISREHSADLDGHD